MLLATLAIAASTLAASVLHTVGEPPLETSPSAIQRILADPVGRQDATTRFAFIERIKTGDPPLSDSELEAAVEILLSDPLPGPDLPDPPLYRLGARAEVLLLKAMDDPRCEPTRPRPSEARRAPFERVVEQLARMGSRAILPRLLPLCEHPMEDVRRVSVSALAKLGAPESIAPTVRALTDPGQTVRSWAVGGVKWSVGLGHASPEFRAALFDALAPYAAGELKGTMFLEDYPGTIIALDASRAGDLLASDRCLRPGHQRLSSVLTALLAAEIRPDPALLHALYDTYVGSTLYDAGQVRGQLLFLLAHSDAPAARAVAEAELAGTSPALRATRTDGYVDESVGPSLRAAAAEALCIADGLPTTGRVAAYAHQNPDAAPREARHIALIYELTGETYNGGLEQYFFNSSGDSWRETLDALRAVGAVEAERILRDASAVFGRVGPAAERSAREEQLERLSEKKLDRLEKLSDELNKDPYGIVQLLANYIRTHPDVFRDLPKASDPR